THRPVDLQPRHITRCPDIKAERSPRTLRDRNLIHDQVDGGSTALDWILREQRDLVRGDDKTVIVVSDDQLTLGREVPRRVGEQVRLIRIRRNERGLAGGTEQCSGVDVGQDGRASWIGGVGEAKGPRVVHDRLPQAIEIGWDEIDPGCRQSVPKRFVIRSTQALWCRRQVRNDDVACARCLELHDRRDLILGGLGHVGNPLVGRQVVERKVDVVAAGADQVERIRVRDATVRRKIIIDLRDSGHGRSKEAVAWVIHVVVTSAAGRIVGAARLIGGNGGGAKKAREQLARHQTWAGRCTPGPLGNRARKQCVEVGSAPCERHTTDNVVAVPARGDGAVAEANKLIDRVCSSRTRDRNGGPERQKTQYMTRATPLSRIPLSAYYEMISVAVASTQHPSVLLRGLATVPWPVTD